VKVETLLPLNFGILGELIVPVTFDYRPGRPGRYYGPPEDCYPDEPFKIDILEVTLLTKEMLEAKLTAELGDNETLQDRLMAIAESQLVDERNGKY
jgi:hypothetical protein